MATLSDIVNIVITRGTAQISRASFGIPLIAGYHTHWTDMVRTYSASTMLTSMITEGFSATEPLYLAATAILSQSPRPKTIKIGRLTSTWSHQVTLVPTLATTGTVFSGRVNNQTWTYTQLVADDTLAEVATAIATAISALDGVTASGVSGTDVVITADTPARLINVNFSTPVSAGVYTYSDTTAAGTIATEVAALRAADKTWYGLTIDRTSEAAINAVAAWAETDRVLFTPTTSDSEVLDPAVTTDVASDQPTSSRKRTSVWVHELSDSFLGAAMQGLILPYDPGAATWAHKSPAGVPTSSFNATQQAAALTKRANILVEVAGISDTQFGTSGTDFLDNVQGEDWVAATMQEEVYAWLRSSPKIPYTNRSVAGLVGIMRGVLQKGVDRGIISPDFAYVVEAPDVNDVSPTDRANRVLPDVFFSFRLSGAIHTVDPITGLVSL